MENIKESAESAVVRKLKAMEDRRGAEKPIQLQAEADAHADFEDVFRDAANESGERND